MNKIIIGIDVGGTHIDGVVLKNRKILTFYKEPYLKDTMVASIHKLITRLTKGLNLETVSIHLSTTISTNTIASNTGTRTSLILETGPGRNYDFSHLDADIFYLDSYIDHQGTEIKAINPATLESFRDKLNQKSLGVIGKFSTRNQSHEKFVANYFKEDFNFITEGHILSGKLNYPRRVETTYLNNYVYYTFLPFAKEMKNLFNQVAVLKADGGTMSLEAAINKPVETIMSGPAASFMGMKALMSQESDGILLDIGGTTTDVFFTVNQEPLFEPKGITIGKHKTLVRSIYSIVLPLGSDSIVSYNNGKIEFQLRKGFAIGFGGNAVTLTDALIVLRKMTAPHQNESIKAIQKLSINENINRLALNIVEEFVRKIKALINDELDKINQKPVYTIKEVLEDRRIKPSFIQAVGGSAKALETYFERIFKLPYEVPVEHAYANALGAVLAKETDVITVLANTKLGVLSVPERGLEKSIVHNFDLQQAINVAQILLKTTEIDLIEAQSFNMVSYDQASFKNIRVVAQVKPGLRYQIKEKS